MKVYLEHPNGHRKEVDLQALNEVKNTALLKDHEGNLQEIEIQSVILELPD